MSLIWKPKVHNFARKPISGSFFVSSSDLRQGLFKGVLLVGLSNKSSFISQLVYCIVCVILKGWSLVPNALRPFQDLLCSLKFRYK